MFMASLSDRVTVRQTWPIEYQTLSEKYILAAITTLVHFQLSDLVL